MEEENLEESQPDPLLQKARGLLKEFEFGGGSARPTSPTKSKEIERQVFVRVRAPHDRALYLFACEICAQTIMGIDFEVQTEGSHAPSQCNRCAGWRVRRICSWHGPGGDNDLAREQRPQESQ